jgi:transglutaminase-like putative cysteine protease
MLSKKIEDIDMVQGRSGNRSVTEDLAETVYCDHSHPAIQNLSDQFTQSSTDPADLVSKVFLFVRDSIAFGGDHWQVKASKTLAKGYGACFNKNLLMIAILRAAKVPSKLMANPLKKTFTKLSAGSACHFFSDPFFHGFTKVLIDGQWKALDPTLDRRTYEAFFKPARVTWKIDWDGTTDMLLYSESVVGPSREINNIDEALNNNVDSYFLFRHEPRFICSTWLRMGNRIMWRKARRFSRPDRPGCDGKTR